MTVTSTCFPLKAIATPISPQEKEDLFTSNGCDCAEDLRGNYFQESELKKPNLDTFQNNQFNQNTNNLFPQIQAQNSEVNITTDPNKWRFQFQPYVTVPINTYGTATARGRSVDYHLSLGEMLDALNFTASARAEAWKGRLGFIVDGYFVNLGNVVNLQKQVTRTPSALDALNYLSSKGTNTRLTDLVNNLDQKIQTAKENKELKQAEIVEKVDQLEQQINNLKVTISEDVVKIENIDLKVKEIANNLAKFSDSRIGDLNFQNLDNLKLTPDGFKELLALNIRDFPQIQDLQELNNRIENTRVREVLSSIPQIKQKLIETKSILEQSIEKIKEERKIKETEELQKLQAEIEQAKSFVEQELAKIQKTEDFLENRLPQELDMSSKTDLNFKQGIYDFAISYHFGEIPDYRLPEKPSNRPYPLLWFEPIAGVRLNNLSLNIEETINVVATSTIVNFNGSFQNNYSQSKTWLGPMLGAKVGVQMNDAIALWLRGDYAGFGVGGETDYSWNVLGGMDWWVGYNTSLQLGYRFYEINYQNGSGNNAFGFQESFNGPFLSATFHF
ncbi:hypothetical protein [Geminocystis sp. GBBB08]|uniref:hypothetical protein n=1 Tax=Geminocystis sp. GBBB08 TaxID=2604140 RepID=UPI0027E38CCE|nr:hypothetical protein [Geminocystis sp. GBBB08]MBL1209751.1 hypothetical protein [Geminocystis sp. GBBB08]